MAVKYRSFRYQTRLKWTGGRKGEIESSGKPTIEIATPPEFKGGIPGVWSPEDFFVASVNACIMTTFLFLAEGKVNLLEYTSESDGTLENVEGKFMFSTVEVRPKLKVQSSQDAEAAKTLLGEAEKLCLISNSIKSRVTLKSEIEVA
ncbi:MAG: OsmC family protein [bacterium]